VYTRSSLCRCAAADEKRDQALDKLASENKELLRQLKQAATVGHLEKTEAAVVSAMRLSIGQFQVRAACVASSPSGCCFAGGDDDSV
jgi:hypothetical protein